MVSITTTELSSPINRHLQLRAAAVVLALCAVASSGCASTPYSFGSAARYYSSPELAARTEVQMERGRPHKAIDTFGWIWGIPSKILLWDRRVENHRIDAHTETQLATYLSENELSTVKVRLNQYHPRDDWHRLVANKSVGAGWRYTVGAVSVAVEAIFPGRLFGGDHYNPFTNTIHLYSGSPEIALHEAGHAKDFARRKWKGTYAAARILPIVPLIQEAIATSDALGYLEATQPVSAQQEAYEILYPAYGTYVGAEIKTLGPFGVILGALGGHAVGQWQSWQLEEKREEEDRQYRESQIRKPQNTFAPPGSEMPSRSAMSEKEPAVAP
jgi:hypothetical protein